MQRLIPALAASVLLLAPLGVRAADLVVWWDQGFYPEEDQAVRDMVAAYQQQTGEKVELDLIPQWELGGRLETALEAESPPDLARGGPCCLRTDRWAAAGLLTDLSEVVLPVKQRFFPGLLQYTFLPSPTTGEPIPYSVPVGQFGFYIHVWASLLARAGLTLDDIPTAWGPFWAFWCQTVQPAVRKALNRDDLWGIGLAMSPDASDTADGIEQFTIANSAYLSSDSPSSLDDPDFRRRLIKSVDDYTAIYRTGCTPPAAPTWKNPDNNQAFLEQRVIMTVNTTLSIPAALRASRAEDYFKHSATIDWPEGPDGRIFPLLIGFVEAVVFRQGQHVEAGKRFLRFLLDEDWLGTSLEAAQGRYLPMLVEQIGTPFWTDPSDPHRRPAVEQLVVPSIPDWGPVRGWRPEWGKIQPRQLLAQAVHRVAADGISPEQAVDEAIARIKQILSEQPP
jgi:multiple sugar transport system substrate-binding protein